MVYVEAARELHESWSHKAPEGEVELGGNTPSYFHSSPDFGEVELGGGGGKQVFACHNFLDYSGEARKANIPINIEETMAILTR